MKAAENYDIKCESRVCINILKDSHLYFGMFLCYDEYSIEKDEKNTPKYLIITKFFGYSCYIFGEICCRSPRGSVD